MFAEFFFSGTRAQRAFAWGGILWYITHSAYRTWVKWRVNEWYAEFYNLLQTAAVDVGSGSSALLADRRDEVWDALVQFATIVGPNVALHPLLRLVQSAWLLNWRTALVREYLLRWKRGGLETGIEGAAQRVHEDARLFTEGIGGIVRIFIDAVAVVAVFAPVLYELGGEVVPIGFELGSLRSEWLLEAVLGAAVVATVVTFCIGRRLVRLEIDAQRSEATLRTLLVWLESCPSLITETLHSHVVPPPVEAHAGTCHTLSAHVLAPIYAALSSLWRARARLLCALSGVGLWLGVFEEAAVLAPYFLAGPLLFADEPARRISLGTLVQLSNALSKMVGALAVIAENYPDLNAFAAVAVRLRQFEHAQYGSVARRALLAPADAIAMGVELGSACNEH